MLVLHDGVNPIFARSRHVIAESLKIFVPELLSEGYHFYSLDIITNSDVVIRPTRNDIRQ